MRRTPGLPPGKYRGPGLILAITESCSLVEVVILLRRQIGSGVGVLFVLNGPVSLLHCKIGGNLWPLKSITQLRIDFSRVVIVKAAEGQAVVHEQMAVAQIQNRHGGRQVVHE